MLKRILKRMTNNLVLKILSIFFAVILWLIVVSVDDPSISKSFSVDVKVRNENVISEMGKVYDIVDGRVAFFSVYGKRSQIESLSNASFTAIADLSQMNMDNETENNLALVPIEIKSERWDNQIEIIKKTNNMQITIENLVNKTIVLYDAVSGTPAAGHALSDNGIKLSHPSIVIEGPESVVTKVDRGIVPVELDGIFSNTSNRIVPILYDDQDNVIRADRLNMNPQSVEVTVNILSTKKVPIRCEGAEGAPADGYVLTGIEPSPQVIEVKGEDEELENLNEIRIGKNAVNIDGKSGNISPTVDITPYLPEHISLVKNDNNMIVMEVTIVALEQKTIEIPVSSIINENLMEGYELEYQTRTLNVTVRGLKEDVDRVTPTMLQAKINLEGLTEGSHMLEAEIMLPDRIEQVNTANIQIIIAQRAADDVDNTVEEEADNGDPLEDNDVTPPEGSDNEDSGSE